MSVPSLKLILRDPYTLYVQWPSEPSLSGQARLELLDITGASIESPVSCEEHSVDLEQGHAFINIPLAVRTYVLRLIYGSNLEQSVVSEPIDTPTSGMSEVFDQQKNSDDYQKRLYELSGGNLAHQSSYGSSANLWQKQNKATSPS